MSGDVEGPPLTLRWHEFSRNIGTTSALFRTEKTFSDVTLIVENMKVEAHKFILGSCSSFFLEMLQYSQHPHPLVYLRGVQHKQLLSLLDFMYHGETRVEQDDLPTFLKTAEDLQVKGLTERHEGENNSASPSPCQSPVQRLEFPQNQEDKEREEYSSKEITPMAVDETNRKNVPDSGVEKFVPVTTSSKSSKRNRQENLEMKTNKFKKGSEKDLHMERREEYEPTVRKIIDELIPNVTETEQERTVSGLFKSATTDAEGDIEALKNQIQPEERHKEVENVSTTITDATDDTISEVERILQESKKILGEERDNEVFDVSDGNISSSGSETLLPESSKPLPARRKSRSKKPPLNTVMRERQLMKFVHKTKTPIQIPGNIPLPDIVCPDQVADNVVKKTAANFSVSSDLVVEPEFPITPEKSFQPSEKDKQVIACLVVKLTGVQGWRCTMCRQTFLSKSETEEHVGINHVLGNLN